MTVVTGGVRGQPQVSRSGLVTVGCGDENENISLETVWSGEWVELLVSSAAAESFYQEKIRN